MKRFAKLVAVLLPLAMVMTGCPNGGGNGGDNGGIDYAWNTGGQWITVFHTYETEGDGSFHFHVNEGYIEIQRIFLNNTATDAGATILFDFTAEPAPTYESPGANLWWANQDLIDHMEDAATANGRFRFEGSDEGDGHVYGGGFGSPAFANFSNIGFVIRTTGGGNTRFEFAGGDIHFGSLLP